MRYTQTFHFWNLSTLNMYSVLCNVLPYDIVWLLETEFVTVTECHVCRRCMFGDSKKRFQFCSKDCYEHI